MPERDVLQARAGVAAERASEAGDTLAELGVALVRHRGGAGLALGEGLSDLADLGALQPAHLGREFLERGADAGEHGEVEGVAVALDDLRGDLGDAQAEAAAGALLDLGRDGGVGADGARHLADGDGLTRGPEALGVAIELGDPDGELEPERRRLGVDAVRAPHADRALVRDGAARDDLAQPAELAGEHVRGGDELETGRGVPDVVGGQPVVDPARLRAERVGDRAQERRDVVVGLIDVAVDRRDVDGGVRGDLRGVLGGHDPGVGPSLRRGDLHVEPALELVGVGPDLGDLGARVARDHRAGS